MDKISFAVDSIEINQAIKNAKFVTAKVKAFASGKNAHKKPVSQEVLRKRADTILSVPVVWVFNNLTQDIGTHSPYEIPCGFVPDKKSSISFEEDDDGRLWLICEVLIWKKYTGQLVDILKKSDGIKPVSVEMAVMESEKNEDGEDEILDFFFTAITLLGTYVKPAVKDAQLEVTQFAADKAEYELIFSKYKNLSFSVPEDIQAVTKKEIDSGCGGTAVALATARRLTKGGEVTPEFIRKMMKYFSKHHGEQNKDWNYFGGDDGYQWVNNLANQMDEIDNQKVNFSEDEEFSVEDKEGETMTKQQMIEFVAQFSLTTDEMFELMRTCLEQYKYEIDDRQINKYWITTYNAEHMFCYDEENGGKVAIPYAFEDGKIVANVEGAKKAKMVTKWVIEDDESFAESDDDDVYMAIKQKFSSDANTEATAQAALNEEEAAKFKEMSDNWNAMETQMADIKTANETLMAENESLKAEKMAREEEDKKNQVEFALQDEDVQKYLTKDEIEDLRQDAVNFAIDDLENWVNKVQSKAFLKSKDAPPQESYSRMGLPFYSKQEKKTGSVYDRLP